MKVVVCGGYGTFGTIVSRALAPTTPSMGLVVAGRNRKRAQQLAAELGCDAAVIDVCDEASCRATLDSGDIVANCAGPFQALTDGLIRACLDRRAHYVDIADDRAWCRRVAAQPWRARGLSAVYGCSSLPGISGALATVAQARFPGQADGVRVTLFIGNRNPKGTAAVASVVSGLGRPIEEGPPDAGPQREGLQRERPVPSGRSPARGFRNSVAVSLPPPFGRRCVVDLDSPDRDEFPTRLGLPHVEVKVGFESALAMRGFALLARLGPHLGARTARWLSSLSRALPASGHSGGIVMCTLRDGPRSLCRAAIGGPQEGQRMAVLPAVLAVADLRAGRVGAGARPAFIALGAQRLLDHLVSEGYPLTISENE